MDLLLHPPLTSFPFALLLTATLLEAFQLLRPSLEVRNAIRIILFFAGFFIIAAFLSGYQASELANKSFVIADELISKHHSVGRLAMIALLSTLVLHEVSIFAVNSKKVFWAGYYIFLILAVILVVYTGYLGGELVFRYGAGVGVVEQ